MFTARFSKYACVNDSITCTIGKYAFKATIKEDSDYSPNDCDCYSESDIARWKNDDWFFCGIVLSCEYNGISLECNESLWAIECNYSDNNAYLLEVANELLLQYKYEDAKSDMLLKLS